VAPEAVAGVRSPDLAAALVAARQFGVIALRQLVECGMSGWMVSTRVRNGRLVRLHRGVYAFGHAELRHEGRLVAALFACGPGAVLSHRSAAAGWALRPTARRNVEVTIEARGTAGRHREIDLHAVRRLDPRDVTIHERMPVTTVARTIVDVAATSPRRVTERVLEQAYVLRLLTPGALEDAMRRATGRPTQVLAELMDENPRTGTVTASALEEAFLAMVREAGLPDPEVNVAVAGYVVDFLWRDRGLAIETDGFAARGTPRAFERDRARDIELRLAGIHTHRFTHNQVVRRPDETLERLLALYHARVAA